MTVKKLSTNFTLQELCFSQTALNHGWTEQQLPTEPVLQNLQYLANKCLEPIRAKFGKFSPTSGYRCKRLNDAKNSTDASFHLIGCAADINFGSKEKNKKLFEWIKANLEFTELINEHDFSWVHVAIQKGRENERKVKVIK